MNDTPPVSFENLARTAANPAAGGYPYQIRGTDLDKNFVFATLKIAESSPNGSPQPFSITEITGAGGHTQRSLAFHPSPPSGGNGLLFSFNNGDYAWESSKIPDGDAFGQMLYWSEDTKTWQLVTPKINGQMLYWNADAKEWQLVSPVSNGQMLYWSADAKKWQTVSPVSNGQMLYWNANAKEWNLMTPPTSGTHVLGSVNGVLQWITTEEC